MVTSVRLDYRDQSVRRWLRGIPGAVDKATARGLNKGVAQARTKAKTEIRKHRNLPARQVTNDMRALRATRHKLRALLVVDGRPRSLRRYGAKVVGRRGRGKSVRNAPVQVEVVPGRKKIVRGGFVRKSDGAVFRRTTAKRYPLKFLFGPSTTSAFAKPRVIRAMEQFANGKVPRLIEHEMRRELKRV